MRCVLALWASRSGLSEAELLRLLGSPSLPLPQAICTPLFLAIKSWLVVHSGRILLAHLDLRDAVADCYLRSDLERKLVDEHLVSHVDSPI